MTLYELLVLNDPYYDCESSFEISEKIIRGESPKLPQLDSIYDAYIDLFHLCTDKNPENRPTTLMLIDLIKKLPDNKETAAKYVRKSNLNFSEYNDLQDEQQHISVNDITLPCTNTTDLTNLSSSFSESEEEHTPFEDDEDSCLS